MNVKELFHDCLQYEESALAHYIHHLLTERLISLEDNISKLDLDLADHQKVADMIEKNVLGFHKMNIYSLKMNERDFVFIFARNSQEAIRFYRRTFHHTPLNCHKFQLDVEFTRGKELISFREMRKEFKSFPAVVGCYKRVS
ncbi:hypothetical protein [Fredinandcohnia quinoae]|uniref:Sporulation inhibitor of replication protein SirA n=1 Tax=Fredinandcohnia quinoae TaxID=2918902 RepID=A0AAW5EDA6_9BACI|nr:hypothetical protein [Fredinandcohnia sp. SECRCQ15]MCH1627123.1 hypothetical protein [Fredinandcohnia sp. SECRCQ15]